MKFKENTTFLMLKINTPPGIDFLSEHKSILDQTGEVWFCRFGKTNAIKSKITADGNYIFFKDSARNNNRIYVATIYNISETPLSKNYPSYYEIIDLGRPLWFCLSDIKEINPELVNQNFRTKASNSPLSNIYRSMCQSFYIQCISDTEL